MRQSVRLGYRELAVRLSLQLSDPAEIRAVQGAI